MPNVLVLFSPQQKDLAKEVLSQLTEIEGVSVHRETNAQAAINALRTEHSLVVVSTSLAADPTEAVSDDGGLAFCRAARVTSKADIILVAPQITTKLRIDANKVAAPTPLVVDDINDVAPMATGLLKQPAAAQPARTLEIQVFAEAEGWRYEMEGNGFEYSARGPLHVPESTWMCWQNLHYSPDHWYLDFTTVGKSITTCLCKENKPFDSERRRGISEALLQARPDKIEEKAVDTRLAFVVHKSYYRLVLEAIFNPMCDEPWLADARLVRRILGAESAPKSLFQTRAPLRALLICADASGTVRGDDGPGVTLSLRPLSKIHAECKGIAQLLAREDGTGYKWFNRENIHTLGGDGQPLTETRLIDKLKEGAHWDLIHFTGHSYFRAPLKNTDEGAGYLFIGEPGRPEAIAFKHLAGYLRMARFVYLSSCESGNSDFAQAATENDINTILGYRWRVGDRAARVQAWHFYRELVRQQSVESAFWMARRSLYRKFRHRQDCWASAMLVTH